LLPKQRLTVKRVQECCSGKSIYKSIPTTAILKETGHVA